MADNKDPTKKPRENFTNPQGQPTIIQAETTTEQKVSTSLEMNISMIQDMFFNDDTIRIRQFASQKNAKLKCALINIDGMVDHDIIDRHIIFPINEFREVPPGEDLFEMVFRTVVSVDETSSTEEPEKIAEGIVSGDTVLFVDGYAKALVINTKKWPLRSVQEPDIEKVLRGPREGFIESILMNLALLRRKIQSPELKFKFKTVGARTHTRCCIVYHETLANHEILGEVVRRLNEYDLDATLGSEYIISMIRDAKGSPFKTMGVTERPDVAAAKILEGRIAIFVEGTPVVITLPYTFLENLQSNEDYYVGYHFASMMRVLRFIAFFMTITIPAIYIALIGFHQEFLPTPLLLSILSARESVPFPSIVELVLMLAAFEVLREAGARMPSNVGQALSIVGALVLGQAAVEAKIVSAPVIIVAALTGISAIVTPRLSGALIIVRILLLAGAMVIGMYGFMLVFAAMFLHLFNIRSFGVPYMLNLTSFNAQDMKDTFIRAPWWDMRTRPKIVSSNIRRRGKA